MKREAISVSKLPGANLMGKNLLIGLLATVLLTINPPADAQQSGKVPRIGFLDNSTASSIAVFLEAFRQELSKLGWIEGKNITVEYRFAEQKNERLPELAAELVRLKVDLVVVSGTQLCQRPRAPLRPLLAPQCSWRDISATGRTRVRCWCRT